jgi:galacturonosyltransferase
MKNILIITNHSYMFWQFRRELVSALIARGHRVTLALPLGDRAEDLAALGCRLIDTPINRRGTSPKQELSLFRLYRQILSEVKPDIVVTYSIKPNLYGGLLCGSQNIPCCINVQGLGTAFQVPILRNFVAMLYRAATHKARVIFFENRENARLFRERRITTGERQCILSGAGINLEHYALVPYPENDKVHFLYLGRVMREKGISELFEAVRRLHDEGESFHLDLVGFYEDSYADQVEELVARGICTFHGFQTETRPYYAAADCVVLPSYHEGMSNVLLEASAIGRPIITSDIPGCREAVDEGISGYTCPPKDAEALYGAMKRFLALSREQRAAMGLAGNAKMRAEFDKNTVIEKTIAAIFKEASHEAVH